MPAVTGQGKGTGVKREIPPALIAVVGVIFLIGLAVGGFYVVNGGWQTSGMKDDMYKHEVLPILQAKHGDKSLLEAENKLRKEQGKPLLTLDDGNKPPSPEALKAAELFKQKAGSLAPGPQGAGNK